MAETFKKLYQGQLPTTAAIVYTAPAGVTGQAAIVRSIRVVNNDTVPRWFTLYQSGTGLANKIIGRMRLDPEEALVDNGPFILSASDTLAGAAEVASMLTCTISGMEIT